MDWNEHRFRLRRQLRRRLSRQAWTGYDGRKRRISIPIPWLDHRTFAIKSLVHQVIVQILQPGTQPNRNQQTHRHELGVRCMMSHGCHAGWGEDPFIEAPGQIHVQNLTQWFSSRLLVYILVAFVRIGHGNLLHNASSYSWIIHQHSWDRACWIGEFRNLRSPVNTHSTWDCEWATQEL